MSQVSVAVASTPVPSKATKVVRGYPVVGNLVDALRDAPELLTRVARERPGEIVGFRLGPMTVYLVTHPDHVQQVLQEDWRSFGKGGMWRGTKLLLGKGLASVDQGDFWLRQRRMMQPLFNAGRLASLTDMMVDVVDREVSRLVARGPSAVVDMQHEMTAMTQLVVLATMFGPGIDRAETDRLAEDILTAFKSMNLRVFLYFLPESLPLPDEWRYRRAVAAIDAAMLGLVRARRKSGEDRGDLLSALMRARDEDTGEGMDDRQLRDELVTIFVAGNDTTANGMAWLWYALGQSPHVEQRLRAEVAEVLGDRRPTFADLPRLAYTKQVVQEALRLFAPAWIFPRVAVGDVTVGGHHIPAGSSMLLSPFISHRDPAFWPDPEVFDPDRFTAERSAGRPRYAYYPFGGGPRQCIGNHLAMMEAQIITAMMVQRLRPKLVPGFRVVPASATTLTPKNGLEMTLGAAPAAQRS